MNVRDLAEPAQPSPIRLSGRATGHVAIALRAAGGDRPLEAITDRVAGVPVGVEAVTLGGEEPALHEHVVEVVRAVKARGLVCQVFTTGDPFVRGRAPRLLGRLVAAGVDRFLIEDPAGQGEATEPLLALLDAHGVGARVAVGSADVELVTRLRALARHPCSDGAVVTATGPALAAAVAALREGLRVVPTAFRAPEADPEEVATAVFLYWLNVRTGRAVPLVPEPDRITPWLYRRVDARSLFAETMPGARGVGLAEAAARMFSHPARAAEMAVLLMGARGTEDLRFQCVAIRRGDVAS